jgi:NodT family efflux transporter outer membrane factor (OMF) lipoprotein
MNPLPIKRLRYPLLGGLGTALLTGCVVGPNFAAPDPKTPEAWHDAAAAPRAGARLATEADPDPAWWLSFNDPLLSSLIERATRGNPDVQIAVIRIDEARAHERAAAAAGLPKLSGDVNYARADLGEGFMQSTPGSSTLDALTKPVNIFLGALDASWELDLFGKVRRSEESARAAAVVAIGNRDDVLVTLEAEVAQTYSQLRAAQASRDTAQSDFETQQEIVSLTRERAAQGLVTDLDVENAITTLGTTEAAIAQYDRQIAASMNGLAVLVGESPGALDAELGSAAPIPPVPPRVPIGLPSSLARRRPDIRVAEATLHRQTAELGLATAQFYPDVSLTGILAIDGTRPKQLTQWADKFYSFGPSVSVPIFQGGELRANLKLAKAEQAEAAIAYRKTVLNALQDVDNALAAYRTELRRHEALDRTVAAQTVALELARDQYTNGVSSFIDVLTTENSLAQQHQLLIESTLSLTTDLVTLYKALGGGWQLQSGTG